MENNKNKTNEKRVVIVNQTTTGLVNIPQINIIKTFKEFIYVSKYKFNTPKISSSHEYYHTPIIAYQITYTSPQFTLTQHSPNHINARIHQFTYPSMTYSPIYKCMQCS